MNHAAITDQPNAGFRPWHFFVLCSLLAATAAVLMAPRPTPEHLVLISLTLGAAGLVGAAFHRTLLPLVSSGAALASEPLGRRSRAALEREKTLILRSIKELEFDRAMGKVADQDFHEMVGRLRGRALAIMKQLEAGTSYREMIEKDLAKRTGADVKGTSALAAAGSLKPDVAPEARPAFAQGASAGKSLKPSGAVARSAEEAEALSCACGTSNDRDARFCKSCGARLEVV